MKIGIVGAGIIGSTTAFALLLKGLCREIVLIDQDIQKAQAHMVDLQATSPLSHNASVEVGNYADLKDADLVVVTAGIDQGQHSRSELLSQNSFILEDILPKLSGNASSPIVLATQPTEVMTGWAAQLLPSRQIIGLGTLLETARLKSSLSSRTGISPNHIEAYVIGESGPSAVVAWSQVRVGGFAVADYFQSQGWEWSAAVRQDIENEVSRSYNQVVEHKGAISFAVGAGLAQIIASLFSDQGHILTVCTAVDGAAISRPTVLSNGKAQQTLNIALNEQESHKMNLNLQSIQSLSALRQQVTRN
ncbi:MAG: hypothetical protein U0Z75_05330 [Deinococcaceae bacterium]